MNKNLDTIQFETRTEVGEVLNILDKYKKAFPEDKNNPVLKVLYNLLDDMEMCW